MNRRDVLALAPAVVTAGLLPRRAAAQDGPPDQFTAVQRLSLGDWTVTALSDGYLPIGADALIGIDGADFDALMRAAYRDPAQPLAAVNAYLVETGDRTILIDAGTGDVFGPSLGKLVANLAAAGRAPEDVDALVVTHLHPDHVGGAYAASGAVFANAEMIVSEIDHAFFTDPATRAAAPEQFRSFIDLATGALDAYEGRLTLAQGEGEVAPGLTLQPLPGHTPGHSGFFLESGGETLLIWADIMHVPAVQFPRPDVAISFDVDPQQAVETRRTLLDRVAADRQLVAGMHMPFPGFGYAERAGDGYAFVPAPWEYF